MPKLLIDAINEKNDIHGTFPELFLKEMRDEAKRSYFNSYSNEKKIAVINALQFLHDMYFMEEYEVWDFGKEELVHYYEEEKLEREVRLSLMFWQDLVR